MSNFTATPFLVLALAGAAARLESSALGVKTLRAGALAVSTADVLVWGYTALVLLLFAIYFPVLSGLPVSRAYAESLQVFSTWYW